jgi:transcriptional regulator with XRE-family HTH domain
MIEQYEMRLGYTAPVLSSRDRLAGLIEARQMTQTELAQRSGVPRPTINEILAGKRSISKANAARLARFFGVPIEEFIDPDAGR